MFMIHMLKISNELNLYIGSSILNALKEHVIKRKILFEGLAKFQEELSISKNDLPRIIEKFSKQYQTIKEHYNKYLVYIKERNEKKTGNDFFLKIDTSKSQEEIYNEITSFMLGE